MSQRPFRRLVRRVALLSCCVLAPACASPFASGPGARTEATEEPWIAVREPVLFDQLAHSTMSCGPAALLTALASEGGAPARAIQALGDDAIAHGVRTYGQHPSATRAGVPRFKPDSGVNPTDLLDWTNAWCADLGAEPRTAGYLDRLAGEDDATFCARVHRTLADALRAGAVPIVRVRSFAPTWYPGRSSYLWDGVASHWIAIVGVPSDLEPGASGFAFRYGNPAGGTLETGWAQVETEREFVAARGNAEQWSWVENRPFLVVHAPGLRSLGRGEAPWFLRTVVTLDCAILPAPQVLSPLNGDGAGTPPTEPRERVGSEPGTHVAPN